MGIIKNIRTAAKNRTTYRAGLLQAKAYRALRQATDKKLARFGIGSNHWAFLGLVYDAGGEGIRSTAIAHELGVDASFVTGLWNDLHKKGLVDKKTDKKDSRANAIFLTNKGRTIVDSTEIFLRKEMGPVLSGIPRSDLIAYLGVLEKIIKNTEGDMHS